MQACFSKLHLRWEGLNVKRFGTKYGMDFPKGQLTNLRFADDVILVAQQRSDIKKMLHDLDVVSSQYGLKIHLGKTKVLTWSALVCGAPYVCLGTDRVAILAEFESERYLGRKLSFACCMDTEFANRISAGWAAFHKHKAELCNKFYRIQDRARLFEAVVTPAVLYGSATWALTRGQEKKLTTVRRKMLRFVFQIFQHRQDGELQDWIDFLKQSATKVDDLCESLGMESWTHIHRLRKWRFAGQIARKQDSRWSLQAIVWKPNHGLGRSPGRPRTRWSDQLEVFAGGDWMQCAQNPDVWEASAEVFAAWVF